MQNELNWNQEWSENDGVMRECVMVTPNPSWEPCTRFVGFILHDGR